MEGKYVNYKTCTIIQTKANCFDNNQTVVFSDKYEYRYIKYYVTHVKARMDHLLYSLWSSHCNLRALTSIYKCRMARQTHARTLRLTRPRFGPAHAR